MSASVILRRVASAPLHEVLLEALALPIDPTFELWLRLELDGYGKDNPVRAVGSEMPLYRIIPVTFHDPYGTVIQFDSPHAMELMRYPLPQPASELEDLARGRAVTYQIPDQRHLATLNNVLRGPYPGVNIAWLEFRPRDAMGVISAIRTSLVLRLKALAKGENPPSRASGASVTNNFNIGDVGNLTQVVGSDARVKQTRRGDE